MITLQVWQDDLRPDVGRVYLSGRMDIAGVQETELKFTVLTSSQKKSVIVDLSAVELITSVGLGMLIRNANNLRAQGHSMIVFNPIPQVEKVLRMAGLGDLLPIEFDLQTALGRIQNS